MSELERAARAALATLDLIAQGQAFTEHPAGPAQEAKARRQAAQVSADRLRDALPGGES